MAKPNPQRETQKRGGGETAPATHKEGGRRIKEARRWRSRTRSANPNATKRSSEEEAKPPPQRETQNRGGGETASATYEEGGQQF